MRLRNRWQARVLVAIFALGGTACIARTVVAAAQRGDAPACASWATRVDGVVVDCEGKPIAGALVVARPVVGGGAPLEGSVVTDRAGRFQFVGLRPGDYWFVSLQGGRIATTPSMPVEDRLMVTISLVAQATPA